MKTRGSADPVTLTLLAVVVAGMLIFTGRPSLPAFLQPKPKTAQLSQTEQDLATARAAQAVAEAKLAKVEADRKTVGEKQLDYAQQMAAGTVLALGQIAPGQMTAEVKLATEFATRTEAGLEAYRGKLTPEARAEMEHLVAQGLSAVQAERDALKAELARKDAALAQTIAVKSTLEAQIPTLRADVAVAKAETATFEAKASTLVRQVADYADGKAKAAAEAGSWQAYFWWAVKVGVGLCILYVVGHIWLPSIGQSYPGGFWEKAALLFRNLTSTHS